MAASRHLLRSMAAIVLVAGAAYLGWSWSERSGIEALREAGQHRLNLYSAGIDAQLGKYDYLLTLARLNQDVTAYLRQPGNPALRDKVNRYLQRLGESADSNVVYLMDARGVTVASGNWQAPDSFVGMDFSFRPYFQDALKAGQGRFYGIGTASKKIGYFFSLGIQEAGTTIGVAVLKVGLERIEASWRQRGEVLLVVDANDVVFLSSVPTWKFRAMREIPAETMARIRQTRQYDDVMPSPLDVTGTDELAYGGRLVTVKPGRSAVPAGLPTRAGTEYFALSRDVAGADWRLVLLSDLAPVRATNRIAALASAFAMALLLLLVQYLAQRRRVIAQRLAAKEALQRAHDELELRVEERTSDLRAANERLRQEVVERKRAEETLRAAQDELVQAGKMAAVGQMSAGITHELNQPLSALRTLSDNARVLLDRGSPAEAQENLARMAQIVERMGRITGQLKAFARKSSIQLKAVSLQRALANSVMLVEQRLQEEGIQLVQEVDEGEILVMGDAHRLEQVLVNLLCNACDAVAGCPVRRLHVGMRRNGRAAIIRVRDTGCGIPHEVLPRLFEPFFTTKDAGKGLGLGLAICAGIVRDFGGSLHASNAEGGGAEFEIELRCAEEVAIHA